MRCRLLTLMLLFVAAAACQPEAPRDQSALPPLLRRADAAFQRGDLDDAARLYRAALADELPPSLEPQANYKLALTQYRLRQYPEARTTLDHLRERFPEAEWLQVAVLYGDIELALGLRVSAVMWWDRALNQATDAEHGKITARLEAAVSQMSEDERHQARALATAATTQRLLDSPPHAAAARTGSTPLPRATAGVPTGAAARLGVLLPLSGANAAVGEHALDGVRLAVDNDDDRLVVRDSGERGASAQIRELSRDASIVAAIGPLSSREADEVVPAAQADGLPLFLLAQREGLAGGGVVQMGMTRSLQAETVAAYAVNQLALRHVAVLHPNDAYGKQLVTAFRQALEAQGGRVVGATQYIIGQREFAAEIEQLAGWDARARLDALFIPDSAEAVARIAPLVKERLSHVQLLGTSEWNDPQLLRAGRAVEGAIFADGFFADSTRPATRTFVERFTQHFGRRPGLIEAQAYDAATLASEALSRGPHARPALANAVRDFGTFNGAAGDFELHAGTLRRHLFLLRVHNGRIEEVL